MIMMIILRLADPKTDATNPAPRPEPLAQRRHVTSRKTLNPHSSVCITPVTLYMVLQSSKHKYPLFWKDQEVKDHQCKIMECGLPEGDLRKVQVKTFHTLKPTNIKIMSLHTICHNSDAFLSILTIFMGYRTSVTIKHVGTHNGIHNCWKWLVYK